MLASPFSLRLGRQGCRKSLKLLGAVFGFSGTDEKLNDGAKRLGLNGPLNDAKRETGRCREGAGLRQFFELNTRLV